VTDPWDALGVKNAKYAGATTELHLAKKGYTNLGGFGMFTNTEVLWINDNSIRRLSGIEECFRIKELYAHRNCVDSLVDSSIYPMTFLHTLTLFENRLEDLHSTLPLLSRMKHLKHLDLFGNPLAEETGYRLHTIKALPWLDVLDRRDVTEEERKAARSWQSGTGTVSARGLQWAMPSVDYKSAPAHIPSR